MEIAKEDKSKAKKYCSWCDDTGWGMLGREGPLDMRRWYCSCAFGTAAQAEHLVSHLKIEAISKVIEEDGNSN